MTPKDFPSLFPGMDFFKPWWPGAEPAASPWTTPTLDPEQLAKRIDELKTVKFWLENNVRMLDASIQALEVQRGTLATLSAMKLTPEHLQEALRAGQHAFTQASSAASGPAPGRAEPPSPQAHSAPAEPPQTQAPPLVDPMKWWQQLGEQFQTLAQSSLQAVGEAAAGMPSAAAPATQASNATAPAGKPGKAPAASSATRRPRKPAAGQK